MALDKFQPYLFVSAGEQSNKLLTPTYSGGIASFQAQRVQSLTGLTVRIDLIQAGTGDPSPSSNVRPISGRTGMTVTVSNVEWENIGGYWYNRSSNPARIATKVLLPVEPSTTLTITGYDSTYGVAIQEYANTGETQSGNPTLRDTGWRRQTPWTLTLTENTHYIWICMTIDNATPISVKAAANVSVSGVYVPHNYPITWQTEAGTVYGGTLDVVSGVLTVDKGFYTITDADYPTLFQAGTNANRVGTSVAGSKTSPTEADRLNIISNIAKADVSILTASQQGLGQCCLYSGAGATNSIALFGVPTTEDTASKAIQWLVAQGCTFVYPLATPQTYQLTPTDVKTLAGFNQIYSDAGPVIDIKF